MKYQEKVLACEYYQSSNKQQPAQLRKILAWLRAIMPAEEQAMRSLRGLKRTRKMRVPKRTLKRTRKFCVAKRSSNV